MSIIVALASKKNGVVASDSRKFLPAKFQNCNRVRVIDATPDAKPFDKTFALHAAGIIGAFAGGVVEFSGITVREHAAEILSEKPPRGSGLKDVAEFLAERMRTRVQNIDEQEVSFEFRKIDLLLVGKSGGNKSDLNIAQVAIRPQDGAIVSHIDFSVIGLAPFVYRTVGDESACRAAHNYLDHNRSGDRSLRHMKYLVGEAVKQGVGAAGQHPHGKEKSCGGQTFLKSLNKN